MTKRQDLFQRNILALSLNNPKLSGLLNSISPSRDIIFLTAKNGDTVPAKKIGGRILPFHSTFDPVRDGTRYFENNPHGSFMIIIGFGAGYHIKPFLACNRVAQVVVIEKDISLLKSVLQNVDVSEILSDSRLTLLSGMDFKEITDFLLSNYFPAISGDLQTIILQIEYRIHREYLKAITNIIKSALNSIADDYTVQAHFGKKWFSNTLLNLPKAEESFLTLKPFNEIIITGAGPSLELQMNKIKETRKDKLLLATDTSLPTLLKSDIVPDLVISIDCQQVSYHHFLAGIPSDIPLVIDLASPPILTRISKNIFFFSSPHPFSIYLNRNWRRFPIIDTSGGNVSHAAISLASNLGAKIVYLYGIDYSYPEGKAYARGTYIYPYFRSIEKRISPLEGKLFSFIMDNRTIRREKKDGVIIYTTKPMSSYRTRLEASLIKYSMKIIQAEGMGLPLSIKENHSVRNAKSIPNILTAGPIRKNWRQFLIEYLEKVKSLPEPFSPTGIYLRQLKYEDRDIWYTQFPAAAAIRETYKVKDISSDTLLKEVRNWTISKIEEYLIEN